MKKSLDPNKGTATFRFKGKDIEVDLSGISKYTYTYLALVGVHEIMTKRKDPAKVWNDIYSGAIARKTQKVPLTIVLAICHVYGIEEDEALNRYQAMSRSNKMKLRNDTRIKLFLSTYGKETHVELSDLEPPYDYTASISLPKEEIVKAVKTVQSRKKKRAKSKSSG